ncbi:MAG: phosphate ABC transporter permease PstA, partial [Saprospiraceae bacterium]
MARYQESRLPHIVLLAGVLIVCFILGFILFEIFSKGGGVLSWEFVSAYPRKAMTAGGILPAILGTAFLTIGTALVSIPLGIACAIYLNEYARDDLQTRAIRAAIRNLAGVPSIIFGLFGLALFVKALDLGTSLMSAGLTLGLLTLPYTITTAEEALKTVPRAMREGAMALGATQFETIRSIVLPAAIPG